jgi:hypothetical protein
MHISAGPDLWESFDTPSLVGFYGLPMDHHMEDGAERGAYCLLLLCRSLLSSFPFWCAGEEQSVRGLQSWTVGRRGRITITKYTPLVLVFLSFRLFISCVISWLGRYSIVSSTCLGCL